MKNLPDIRPAGWFKGAVYGLLLTGMYWSALAYLFLKDWTRDDYSYGYIIPFVVLYLIWDRRERLTALPSRVSWFGFLLVGVALCLFWVGELGGEYFSLYMSLWLMIVGLCWLHLGWERLKEMAFPFIMMLTMFPFPNFLYTKRSLIKILAEEHPILVISAFIFRFHSEWVLLWSYLIFSSLVLFGFFLTEKNDWQLKRASFIDFSIKGKLRFLKDRHLLIVFSFRLLQMALPALLFASCFLAADIPVYFAYFALGAALILLLTLIFFNKWVRSAMRVTLYLLIPFVVYFSSDSCLAWMGVSAERIYNISFGVIAFLAILTIKFTRRTNSFKTTPMDFLIILFALVIPNIPDDSIRRYHMGMVAAKIIVLFFTYDVLMGELRENHKWLCLNTMGALSVVSIKGFCGL
jgi:hypothetical protein